MFQNSYISWRATGATDIIKVSSPKREKKLNNSNSKKKHIISSGYDLKLPK